MNAVRKRFLKCENDEPVVEPQEFSECDLSSILGGGGSFDDPALLDYYTNLTNRVLLLSEMMEQFPSDANSNSYSHECNLILRWNIEDESDNIPIEDRIPIKILIDCPGGDTNVMFKLINMIDASRTPVYTVNLHSADSAAGIILMCGHPGKRYCMKYSSVLVHDGSMMASGSNGKGFESTVDYVKRTQVLGDEIIMQRTKISKKIMASWKSKEKFLFAEDQLKYGIVDHILNDFSEIFWAPKNIEDTAKDTKDIEDLMNPPEEKKED